MGWVVLEVVEHPLGVLLDSLRTFFPEKDYKKSWVKWSESKVKFNLRLCFTTNSLNRKQSDLDEDHQEGVSVFLIWNSFTVFMHDLPVTRCFMKESRAKIQTTTICPGNHKADRLSHRLAELLCVFYHCIFFSVFLTF